MENRNRIIIVDGPQGTGKTTLANFLRENIDGANLYRLSGQKEKSVRGKKYSIIMYEALLEYMKQMQSVPMDLIFDRTFFTEEVYARLGYKEYSFTEEYFHFLNLLNQLEADVYYYSLYLKNVELFRERLQRPSHHQYQAFSIDNSVNQQRVFHDIAQEIREKTSIIVEELPMDDFEKSYDLVCRQLRINRK